MIRRHLALLRLALMVTDGLTAFFLFELILYLRFQEADAEFVWLGDSFEIRLLGLVYAVLWVASMWIAGLYRLRTHLSLRGEVRDVLRATAIVAGATLFALFVLNLPPSRLFLISLFVAQPFMTVPARAALRSFLTWIRSRGYNSRQVLIIGTGQAAQAFADQVEQHPELGLRVAGHLRGPRDSAGALSRPELGTIDDLEQVLHSYVVDEVAVCLSPADWMYVEPATRICQEEGRVVRVVIPPLGGVLSGGQYEDVAGTPVVTFLYGPDRVIAMALKRLLDIGVGLLLVILASPIMLSVALAIRLIDGSPVLFRHERLGLHGRPFTCLKFRTMVADAESQQDELEAHSDINGPAFKMTADPRITPLGKTLRRYSLDELPQLFNVLRGDMSIVGPRPAPLREVRNYDIWHRRRLSMRPGLTGLWQIQARGDNDFNRRAELDLNYIDRWSLWLDVTIMLRTLPAIVAQPGR